MMEIPWWEMKEVMQVIAHLGLGVPIPIAAINNQMILSKSQTCLFFLSLVQAPKPFN